MPTTATISRDPYLSITEIDDHDAEPRLTPEELSSLPDPAAAHAVLCGAAVGPVPGARRRPARRPDF